MFYNLKLLLFLYFSEHQYLSLVQTLRVEAPEPTFITIQHQHQMESDLAYCSDLYLTVAFFIKQNKFTPPNNKV